MRKKILSPIHPGEVLQQDFLEPMGLSQYRLAKGIRVPPRRINEIVQGKRGITADTALRLGRFFGTSGRHAMSRCSRGPAEPAVPARRRTCAVPSPCSVVAVSRGIRRRHARLGYTL